MKQPKSKQYPKNKRPVWSYDVVDTKGNVICYGEQNSYARNLPIAVAQKIIKDRPKEKLKRVRNQILRYEERKR